MDNTTRSLKTRTAVIQAALTIIARDGPGRLTLDAIARESGMSKGGLMHQFPNKEAVLRALLDHQMDYFERFSQDYLTEIGPDAPQANLATQIAVFRESIFKPNSVVLAFLGAIVEEPSLLSVARDREEQKLQSIRAETDDPDLALLRAYAAKGLALSAMFGLCPLQNEERERLFERLLDGEQWADSSPSKKKPGKAGAKRK